MIFYFTGTGNSRWVAEALGTAFDEPLVSIADALNEGKNAYPLGEREKVFFVFPVHSWGPAVLVPRFISRLILSGYKGQEVYFVCTCGDDCGYTDRIMRSILARRGIAVTGGFSVQMPNNYVLMPCISCGICAKVCPTGTISLSGDGKPEWADSCVQCVACIHRCPVRAIEYGKISLKKGRYHHPGFK